MTPDPAVLAEVAAQYNIPVSVLYAVGQHESGYNDALISGSQRGSSGEYGAFQIMPGNLSTYGVTPQQIDGNFTLQATLAAIMLSNLYRRYGSWEQALSAYNSGSPTAYQSNPQVAGYVKAVTTGAAMNADYGMSSGFTPSNPGQFQQAATSLYKTMQDMSAAGGVITPDHASAFAAAAGVSQAMTGTGASGVGVSGGSIGGPGDPAAGLQAAAQNNGRNYTYGQCTYYVASTLGWVPGGMGNAGDWVANAKSHGVGVTHTPTVGSAVVYAAGGGYSSQYGHVAVVTHVNPDGTFQVSEMNMLGEGQVDTRTSTMSDVAGFLTAPPGTNLKQTVPSLYAAIQQQVRTGTTPSQQAQHQPQHALSNPAPSEVNRFAEQLRGLNVDPASLIQNYPFAAGLSGKLLGKPLTMDEYASMVRAIEAAAPGAPLTQDAIQKYLQAQPHPVYNDITAGQFHAAFQHGSLYSMQQGRMPQPAAIARLIYANGSGVEDKAMASYYAGLNQHRPPSATQPLSGGPQPQPTLDQIDNGALRQGGPR